MKGQPKGSKVSVIVLNYNGKEHLEECFSSLRRQSCPNVEVLMVDGGSTDGSVEFVRERFPEVRIVRLEKNLGFGEGNNAGVRASRGEYIVLLNNDTACDPGFLRELVGTADSDRRIGGCAAKMLLYDARSVLNSVGASVCLNGKGWDIGYCEMDEGQHDAPREVFAACAGAMLLRREVFEEAGGFDPAYFAYHEDADLCWRIRLLGYKILAVPAAVVYHKLGATSKSVLAERKREAEEKNHVRTVLKNYALSSLFRFFPLMLLQDLRTVWSQKPSLGWRGILRFFLLPYLWNVSHLPSTVRERRRIQRQRVLPEKRILELMVPLFANGYVFAPDYPVMDLERYEREGAKQSEIRMGENDGGALGPGWGKAYVPWKMRQAHRPASTKAFFYLNQPGEARHLRIDLLGSSRRDRVRVTLNGDLLADASIEAREAKTLDCAMPDSVMRQRILEGCLLTEQGWRPHDVTRSGDYRRFGPSVSCITLT